MTLQAALTGGSCAFEAGTSQTLWRILISRLSDKAAGVRAKALSTIGATLSTMSDGAHGRELLRSVQLPLRFTSADRTGDPGLSDDAGTPADVSNATPSSGALVELAPGSSDAPPSAHSVVGADNRGEPTGSADEALLSPSASLRAENLDASLEALGAVLQARCIDEKPAVRRAALLVLEAWVKASGTRTSSSMLGMIEQRCQDTAPSIRKQAAKTLCALLQFEPQSASVRAAWLAGVLPLLRDSESSVSETALDALHEVVLQPLARCSGDPIRGYETVGWALLQTVTAESEPLLRHGVANLARLKRLSPSLATTAQSMLAPNERPVEGAAAAAPPSASGRAALWAVVFQLAKQKQLAHKLNVPALATCWQEANKRAAATAADDAIAADAAASGAAHEAAKEAACALRVLTCLAKRSELPSDLSTSIGQQVMEALFAFDAPTLLLVPLVQACAALLPTSAADGESTWPLQLMTECEARLSMALPPADDGDEHVESGGERDACREDLYAALVIRSRGLVIAGELAVLFPSLLTQSLTAVVQEIALTTAAASAKADKVESETSQATALSNDNGNTLSSLMRSVESALSATALVTLGKFCLNSHDLTKRLLPVFMRELASNSSSAVRNNALVVLHDLSKRHTSLIDRHVPVMARSLCDNSPLVRRQALLLLSQLLLEDYIKWKPPLFRAFAISLVDKEPSLRAVAHSCLFDLLLPRSPLVAFNAVIGLLFQTNGCVHAPHHPAPLPPAERSCVELLGEADQPHRLAIVRALLDPMDDEHKLQVTSKLCHDVLAAVPDGHLNLEDAHWVISDTLMLLACKEIKLSSGVGQSAEDADDADAGNGSAGSTPAAVAAAKSKILSLVARKAMVESIVPIVIELKRHLEGARSPLLKDVFVFLRELLRDHKAHLQDIFARDRQLATEIEYDMRQLAGQPPPRALQPLSPLVFTPSVRGPGSTPRPSGAQVASLRAGRLADAAEVPTPDRMKAFSVPKLRSAGGGMHKPSSHGSHRVGGGRLRLSSETAAVGSAAAAAIASADGAAPLAQLASPSSASPVVAAGVAKKTSKSQGADTAGRKSDLTGSPSAASVPPPEARRSRRGAVAAAKAPTPADVVMSSPLKEAAPPKLWGVCPSPFVEDAENEGGNAAGARDGSKVGITAATAVGAGCFDDI